MHVTVYRAGLFQTDLSCKIYNFNSKNAENSEITAFLHSVTLKYQPVEFFLRRHVRSIALEDSELLVRFHDGIVDVPAVNVLLDSFAGQESEAAGKKKEPPFTADQITMSGDLRLNTQNDTVFIHYNGEIYPEDISSSKSESGKNEWNRLHYDLNLTNSSGLIHAKGIYRHPERELETNCKMNLDSKTVPFALRHYFPDSIQAKGEIEFDGIFNLASKTILSGNLTSHFRLSGGIGNKLELHCEPELKLVQTSDGRYRMDLSGFAGTLDGIPFSIPTLTAKYEYENRKLQGNILYCLGENAQFPAEYEIYFSREGLTFVFTGNEQNTSDTIQSLACGNMAVSWKDFSTRLIVSFRDNQMNSNGYFKFKNVKFSGNSDTIPESVEADEVSLHIWGDLKKSILAESSAVLLKMEKKGVYCTVPELSASGSWDMI